MFVFSQNGKGIVNTDNVQSIDITSEIVNLSESYKIIVNVSDGTLLLGRYETEEKARVALDMIFERLTAGGHVDLRKERE